MQREAAQQHRCSGHEQRCRRCTHGVQPIAAAAMLPMAAITQFNAVSPSRAIFILSPIIRYSKY